MGMRIRQPTIMLSRVFCLAVRPRAPRDGTEAQPTYILWAYGEVY